MEIEEKSRGYLLASPPSVIKCEDVGIRYLSVCPWFYTGLTIV